MSYAKITEAQKTLLRDMILKKWKIFWNNLIYIDENKNFLTVDYMNSTIFSLKRNWYLISDFNNSIINPSHLEPLAEYLGVTIEKEENLNEHKSINIIIKNEKDCQNLRTYNIETKDLEKLVRLKHWSKVDNLNYQLNIKINEQ